MTETNFTDQDIDTLLRILDAASQGPAHWVEPATGVDRRDAKDLARLDPLLVLAEMLYDKLGSYVRDALADFREALKKCGIERAIVHGVSVPAAGVTWDEVMSGGDHLVVAITGNGEKSEANAKAIAAMLDPRFGFAATLRALREMRALRDLQTDAMQRSRAAIEKTPREIVHMLNALMSEGRATPEEVAPIIGTINRLRWELQQANDQAMFATQNYNAKCEEMGQAIDEHADHIEEHAARIKALSGHIEKLAKESTRIDFANQLCTVNCHGPLAQPGESHEQVLVRLNVTAKEPCNCGGPQLFDAQVALEAGRQRLESIRREGDASAALEDLAMLIARARSAVDAAVEKLPTVAGVVMP